MPISVEPLSASARPDPSILPQPNLSCFKEKDDWSVNELSLFLKETEGHPGMLVNFKRRDGNCYSFAGYKYQSHHPSRFQEGRGHSNSTEGN